MVFKWKIVRPPFHAVVENVQVMHPSIELEFETGSIDEAHGIYTDNGTALGEMFGPDIMHRASDLATRIGGVGQQATAAETIADTEERKKRGRGPNKPKNVEATAPDPVTIPGADAPPTAPITDGIPANLLRDPATNTSPAVPAATAPPPPPPPAPPAAPPAAPPTGVLAGKIAAELDRRMAGDPARGQALADWLATSGITVKGATYAEAVTVLRLQADEKLGPIAAQLQLA